jgi:hypothetical protein
VPSGEKPGECPLRCREVHSLQSGSSPYNREIRACFAYFGVGGSGLSLQFRLRGGEVWIRTLGTGLMGVRADVCVSYRESISYPEKEGRVVLRHYGKPVRFPVRSKGEGLAILWLKVVY